MNKPQIIDLPSYADDRGVLTPAWNNWGAENLPSEDPCGRMIPTRAGADIRDVMRAYFINNSQKGVVRGFHYHKNETKYFVVLRGMAKFVAINPGSEEQLVCDSIDTFVLTERKPQMVMIPPGYANGWVSLTDDCLLLALSSSTFEESKNDDKRIDPYEFGDVWGVKPR